MAEDIFRVTFFVKDKDLARAKRALVGIAIDMKDEPVVNAKARASTATAEPAVTAETGGNVTEMLMKYLQGKPEITAFTSKDAARFLESIGRSAQSASYLCRQAVGIGLLKPTDVSGMYKVARK